MEEANGNGVRMVRVPDAMLPVNTREEPFVVPTDFFLVNVTKGGIRLGMNSSPFSLARLALSWGPRAKLSSWTWITAADRRSVSEARPRASKVAQIIELLKMDMATRPGRTA